MSSFRDIDYRVRPAKQIERRMISTALLGLTKLQHLDAYRYVGMGAIAFVDFTLVHRGLGISDMVSIERPANYDRVEFNKPYQCIRVETDSVRDVLSKLGWDTPSIIWLDYDKRLKAEHIKDVGLCAANLQPGSVLMVTLSASAEESKDTVGEMDAFKKAIPAAKLPTGMCKDDFKREAYPKLIRSILLSEIAARLNDRNSLLAVKKRVVFSQFLFFRYADGKQMVTFGWIVGTESNVTLTECGMQRLPFFRDADDAFEIKPPILTPKETRHLNAQLPPEPTKPPTCPGIPSTDIDRYVGLYRHFPLYYEVAEG